MNDSLINTYWSSNGKHQADYDRLVKLMPPMGKCDTVAGEIIRAVSRIAHDLYNNGMGNNTSGSLNYLRDSGVLKTAPDLHGIIYPYTRGSLYQGCYNGDEFQMAVERLIDTAIEHVLSNPQLESTSNNDDMFDYEDEMANFCEDCGVEVPDRWTSLCSYCDHEDEDSPWS